MTDIGADAVKTGLQRIEDIGPEGTSVPPG
jgi:hypothetical protein